MAREMAAGRLDIKMKLLYGCSDENYIIFFDELNAYVGRMPARFQIIYVFSNGLSRKDFPPPVERGLLSLDIIRTHTDPDKDSCFIRGPAAMYDFVIGELKKLGVKRKRIRSEAYPGIKDPSFSKTIPAGCGARPSPSRCIAEKTWPGFPPLLRNRSLARWSGPGLRLHRYADRANARYAARDSYAASYG